MDILVSGSTGLIGSELSSFLSKNNHRVIRLVRRSEAGPNGPLHPSRESEYTGARKAGRGSPSGGRKHCFRPMDREKTPHPGSWDQTSGAITFAPEFRSAFLQLGITAIVAMNN
jgi:nucleoside-diphosphate-sugar epimerase